MTANLPALEGGTPVRAGAPVPFFRAPLTEDDLRSVTEAMRSGWLTLGPRVGEFEAACAARVGSPHAIATSSCTSALFLALRAFDVGVGDEVIVPSLTFAASVNTRRHNRRLDHRKRLEGFSARLNYDTPIKRQAVHTKCGLHERSHWWCFSGGINEEGLRPMSRRFTRSAVWWSQRDSNPCLSLERAPS